MYRKIDIYATVAGTNENIYLWSTNGYETCRDAMLACAVKYGICSIQKCKCKLAVIDPLSIRAFYA